MFLRKGGGGGGRGWEGVLSASASGPIRKVEGTTTVPSGKVGRGGTPPPPVVSAHAFVSSR